MRFSIIIPVYNSEKYLQKTLDSVCLQQFSNFEVICINDGSTDHSLDILENYQNTFSFITIITQNNSGPGAARNKGLTIAKGEYVLFCDSDDWFERHTVLSELDVYIRQQQRIVDAVYFPGNTNWGGNTISASGFQEKQYQSGWELLSDYCLELRGTNLFIGSLYAYVYRLDVIRKHALSFNQNISYSEDRLFVFDFLDKAAFSITYPKTCYFYNVRNNSLMTKSSINIKKINDELYVSETMIKRKWLHKRTTQIKKYQAKFYLSCLMNLWQISEYPKIQYKLQLLYTISSVQKFIKFIVICISPKLYKKIAKQ